MVQLRRYYLASRKRGLTLGEMMIVLLVFSVLASIFLMSYNEAIVKTKLTRVLAEHKVVARALNNYQADYSKLPLATQGLTPLKGPIAYLVNVPADPFNPSGRQPIPYKYLPGLSRRHICLLISVGPDGKSNLLEAIDKYRTEHAGIAGDEGVNTQLMQSDEADKLILANTYDPTNGSVSPGDVITNYDR